MGNNGYYVPKDILCISFSIESAIWFLTVGWRYAKLSLKTLINGEVENLDKRRLIIGMLISLLWIPLVTIMIEMG